jgi:hypothetical protein
MIFFLVVHPDLAFGAGDGKPSTAADAEGSSGNASDGNEQEQQRAAQDVEMLLTAFINNVYPVVGANLTQVLVLSYMYSPFFCLHNKVTLRSLCGRCE